jgi:aspartate/methionine/tyrosine aminotransferase
MTSAALAPFGTTIFTTMTRLALEHGAVNLAQGFPDFDGPEFVREAAAAALRAGQNQYAPMAGVPPLRQAIAARWDASTGLQADPDACITVTSGCTEAIVATFLGLLNPGDEVVLFEPYYDSYRASVAMAGGVPRFVTLRPHDGPAGRSFRFDPAELRAACTARTRAILVNTPHNPTGKVFTREELGQVAEVCLERNLVGITDEVYERLAYEPSRPHISLATLPGMAERTITLSSLGKTYSLTGWKIGWVIAPPELSKAVRAAHQFITFSSSTPLQHAAAVALQQGESYVAGLNAEFRSSRDYLSSALASLGLKVYPSEGTYFIMADHSSLGFKDDVEFCMHLTKEVGVAAIPPSAFYSRPELGHAFARFAYCKKRETLEKAVERLAKLRRG